MRTATTVPDLVMAGWWERFTAYFIDSLILLVPMFALAFVFTSAKIDTTLIFWGLPAVYFVYFWSTAGGGRTPGMRLKKLAVVGQDGLPISVGRAVARYVMFVVSFYALLLGLLWAAWDPKRQGWHDKVAATFVVRPRLPTETAFTPSTAVAAEAAGAFPTATAAPGASAAAGRIRCANCGTHNEAGDRFCGSCGSALA